MTDNYNKFHLFDTEGEEQADRLLGETSHNAELGKQVARDAQRVVAGELSEHKYHQSCLQEFGVDNRPSPNKHISRRTFIRLAAGSGAALAVFAALGHLIPSLSAHKEDGEEGSELPQHAGAVQMGMVIDLERCTGCLACVDACHRENNTSPGVHWIYVFAYKDENQEGVNFLVRPCQHCSNPPCVKVCPVMARHKREKDGLVLTDYDICIGCRYCQIACPYGVNYFQWGEPKPDGGFRDKRTDYRGRRVSGNPPRGVMGKCTFCPGRQDNEARRGTIACQLACPHDAIHFGDMNDPQSPPRRYLEKRGKDNGGRIPTFRLLEHLGTQPNIIYLGHQPSRAAKQVEGPTPYTDWGFIDERRAVLEGPRPWFMRVFGGR